MLGGTVTSLWQVVLRGHGWYAAPWSVCPHIPPGLSSALLCMAEGRGLTPEVLSPRLPCQLGFGGSDQWEALAGDWRGKKGRSKVSVSPSGYREMDSESCTVAAFLPWLRSSSHCTDPLRSTLSWVTPPAPSPPSSLQFRISNSLLVSGLLHYSHEGS